MGKIIGHKCKYCNDIVYFDEYGFQACECKKIGLDVIDSDEGLYNEIGNFDDYDEIYED